MVSEKNNKTKRCSGEKSKLIKILVCGGRDYNDKSFVYYVLDRLNPDIVCHGAAKGADSLAGTWAREKGKEERVYPAKWNLHGRKAGPLRNREMLAKELEGLTGVIAFPGGSGTFDMIKIAKAALPPKSVFQLSRR